MIQMSLQVVWVILSVLSLIVLILLLKRSLVRKRKTKCNTTKLSQPRQNVAEPMHRQCMWKSCEYW